ncbi:major facilitator superfamily domain-containing protein [Lophiotrema nucula]|uniref:Major facilitator superfamily domain-containing protein n=1 Tax=Lophiotrema nucula TaxID=690887 RepID=A0A6A5Z4I5_9PLEO|nr:major facilitator superfamily domain-containing protein [Lophiotrema nucula]
MSIKTDDKIQIDIVRSDVGSESGEEVARVEELERFDIRQDGGLTAWLQVFGCWLLFMNTWGLTNSFAVFETYYLDTKFPSTSPSTISWVGSLQLFLTLFVGIFAGWFLDAGRLRPVLVAGIAFEVLGMLGTSFCRKYWQVIIAQGLCVGIGSGTLAFTSAAVIPFYFTKRRMLAAGIVSTGSSIAGVVYPLMMRELFKRLGFGWAVRVLALIMLVCSSISLLVLKPHTKSKTRPAFFMASFLRDMPYTLFILSYAFMVAGTYVPYFYIQKYALDLSINDHTTFNVISIMNAATFFGRFPYNYMADMYGGIAVLVPCCLLTSLILFLWRFVHNLAGLIVISATFCFITGGLVSLPAPTIANLTVDKAEYRTRMGMGYTVAAIGALVGNPIAGAARTGGNGMTASEVMQRWQGAWFFAATSMTIATVLMIWARILRGGLDMNKKL